MLSMPGTREQEDEVTIGEPSLTLTAFFVCPRCEAQFPTDGVSAISPLNFTVTLDDDAGNRLAVYLEGKLAHKCE
jgi:hypothetical protein